MSIHTYSDLIQHIPQWLDRDDLSTVTPRFIQLAEADFEPKLQKHINNLIRASTIVTAGDEYIAPPCDWEYIKEIWVDEPDRRSTVTYMESSQLTRAYPQKYTGRPQHYTIMGQELKLSPVADRSYSLEFLYYADLDRLSDTNPTNWVLKKYPNIYLFGALVHAANWVGDDARSGFFAGMYQQAVDTAQSEGRSRERGDGPLEILPDFNVY